MDTFTRPETSPGTSQDLRHWLRLMEANGELVTVKGADREREIGGVVDIAMRGMGRPAVLFEDIPGYPKGHRVVANLFTSVRRIALSLGLPGDTSEVNLVKFWRDYMKEAPTIPPKEVNHGALLENTFKGLDIKMPDVKAPDVKPPDKLDTGEGTDEEVPEADHHGAGALSDVGGHAHVPVPHTHGTS